MQRRAGMPIESKLMDWGRSIVPLARLYRQLPFGLREFVSRLSNTRLKHKLAFRRTPAWSAARLISSARVVVPAPIKVAAGGSGINIFGYLRGEFGLGESARQYAKALLAAGVDVALVDLDLGLPHAWGDDSLDTLVGTEAPFNVNLIFVNPDYFDIALERIGADRLRGRRLVACWFWELDRIPTAWLPSLSKVDELLVSSRFIEAAFRCVTGKPITRVALPLSIPPDSGLRRVDFGLPQNAFVFLASFDFNSWIERKNPWAVIEAFREAFSAGNEPVCLLLKTSNGFRYPEQLRVLVAAASADSRIILRDDVIERAHMTALIRCCDAYVSLHRAEGFGLGLAEAMALGKPTIATNWSGNLDFMTNDVACLVDYIRVPVDPGHYPHAEGANWAEPDTTSAAGAMRRLAGDPEAARELGARAHNHVVQKLAPDKAASIILQRLGITRADHTAEGAH